MDGDNLDLESPAAPRDPEAEQSRDSLSLGRDGDTLLVLVEEQGARPSGNRLLLVAG